MAGPIQYIEGSVEFCGINFVVDSRALIPRFETEFIVKKVVDWCKSQNFEQSWHIVDVGTGSGNIAILLALNLPSAPITAVDISPEALSLAQENAKRHNVSDRIHFVLGNLLSPITKPVDIIVANLPYIPTKRIIALDRDVRDFEPHLALDGGSDGLDLYRQLFQQITQLPRHPQLCIFEIDNDQGESVAREIRNKFPLLDVKISKDSSDFVRYVVLDFPNI